MAGDDANAVRMLELLIGLSNVTVLGVDRVDGVLEIHVESTEPNCIMSRDASGSRRLVTT
jgi:hypothetical protein